MVALSRSRPIALALALGALAGCERPKNAYVPPPPAKVTVARPVTRTVPITLDVTGVTRGIEAVEIRARVKGFIEKRHVEGGRKVKTGDLLYTIDPRPFEASVHQAEAEVASARAKLQLAEVTLERYRQAVSKNASPKIELDKAQAERDGAQAEVELADAKLESARLDLNYTQVRAPIDGRLGIHTVDAGALVGANEPTLLATIVNDQSIYATYTLDERQVLTLRQSFDNKRPGEDGRPGVKVLMALENETGFPHEGAFFTADSRVNPDTGTITIEARFDNADGTILPGLYVRLRPVLGEETALTVPDVAVGEDQRGRYVLVVNAENVVERRNVETGDRVGGDRVIRSGLEPEARVIVNGLQRARPGAEVVAQSAAEAGAESSDPRAGR